MASPDDRPAWSLVLDEQDPLARSVAADLLAADGLRWSADSDQVVVLVGPGLRSRLERVGDPLAVRWARLTGPDAESAIVAVHLKGSWAEVAPDDLVRAEAFTVDAGSWQQLLGVLRGA